MKLLPKFWPTIKWLKESMAIRDLDSSFVDDDDCWEELNDKKDLFTKEFLAEIRQAMIASENGNACYLYLLYVSRADMDVRQALVNSGDGRACRLYLRYINKDDTEIAQALIASEYCQQ